MCVWADLSFSTAEDIPDGDPPWSFELFFVFFVVIGFACDTRLLFVTYISVVLFGAFYTNLRQPATG